MTTMVVVISNSINVKPASAAFDAALTFGPRMPKAREAQPVWQWSEYICIGIGN
ncbi:hypothetical protein [Variovorax sp. PBL-E5]|uniref:hypothetical protein n=1 Tax=Variovorax sp. PBL-E5 TaxID=434014 RepID=UPI001E48DF2B|nr:hypothetical protein [Variovorax sp. PBL-E5]